MIMTKVLIDELSREDKLTKAIDDLKQGKLELKENAE
jgi:hypothetical protein